MTESVLLNHRHRRIVVKLGTSTLTDGFSRLSQPTMIDLVRQVSAIRRSQVEIVLVSSGAIAVGRETLHFPDLPKDIPAKQMLAAVGQPRLMDLWGRLFAVYSQTIAQVLLTREDLRFRSRYLNARNTLFALLAQGLIPIVNENDTVATEEIRVGDNDNLSALVANLIDADLLILLTDQDGLYDADPRLVPAARLVNLIDSAEIEPALWEAAGGSGRLGTGGMLTKLQSADLARRSGAEVVIARGSAPDILLRILNGEPLGTRFTPTISAVESRKRFILTGGKAGKLTIDPGAVQALLHGGSLLPAGLVDISGEFSRGETLSVCDPSAREIARGLVNYNNLDCLKLRGCQSTEIETRLGYYYGDEIIHRSNMILIQQPPERLAMNLVEMGQLARQAFERISRTDSNTRKNAVLSIAAGLEQGTQQVLVANQQDIQLAQSAGLTPALIDRLMLNEARMSAMVSDLRLLADLPDPIGTRFDERILPNGLKIWRQRVPLGVLGVIYESRPNVTIDVAGLAVKTGNTAILRGGKETISTNRALIEIVHGALLACDLPGSCVQLIADQDRRLVEELLHLNDYIDVIIPRGGSSLHQFCRQHATIPVITGGIGICHLFVDSDADQERAFTVIHNAKTQRPSVCNSLDTILVHESIAAGFLPRVVAYLAPAGVTFRADPVAAAFLDDPLVQPAGPDDFDTEWLSLVLGLKVVPDIDAAIDHIRLHSTHHSDGILTRNQDHAERFIQEVDSAAVYVNASTRFTDGGQFGLGAEVAVSTQRLHARGPMGLPELTTYKWVVIGDYTARG